MLVPPYLKPGDKIAVVAPARKVLQNDIKAAIKILYDWDLKPYLGKHLWKEQDQFSGDDEQRKMDLQEALDDPDIKAVIAARGGYGTVRIVDRLDFTKFAKHPKWIIGFSDITVLHAHINQNLNICTMHAPMLINFDKVNKDILLKLKENLFGKLSSIEVPTDAMNQTGTVKGEICGGNLSVLYSILGSVSDLDTSDKILFIEDLDEYLYHVDRMMMALKRAGKFSKIKGLIIGGMNDMKDNIIPFGKTAEKIISEYIDPKIPAVYNFPAGHIENNNPIIFGKEVTISVGQTVKLEYS
jgi:muramoyltetrapeptide carboxypeptidase